MRTIYIDADCKCHAADDGTMTAVETDFFDGKCGKFIEGYLLIPEGSSRTQEDGRVLTSPQITPWKDLAILQAYQEQYEEMAAEMEDMKNALNVLEVNYENLSG